MAFTEINSAVDAYNVIAADATMSGLIGTFSFSDGDFPALMIANDSTPLDDIDQVSGLVVVIERDAAVTSTRLLTAQVVVDKQFTIRLIQIKATPRNLEAAVNRLAEIFPGCSITNLGAPSEIAGDGQAVVTLARNTVAVA